MLNPKQIEIIKATAPLVGQHARDITEHFYPLMFDRYPEMIEIFNQTHQKKGTQRQALANALVAYATHIDDLGELDEAVALIAHKHCSLNILPEGYPKVGECLMEAIVAILGDAVTEEVADAWLSAYGQLADLMISIEEDIYQKNSERTGGWRGERKFFIEKIDKESDIISSFYLVPCEGEKKIDFTPGQYVGLIVNVNGESVRRNYSLSDAPGKEGLRISVKKEDDGLVSGYLHNVAKEEDVVTLIPPVGNFVLDPSKQNIKRPVVFVTGGVGITPAISMINSCIDSGREIIFIHAAINSRHHAFNGHLKALSKNHDNLRYFVIYEKPLPEDNPNAKGFIDKDILISLLPADGNVDFYFLGPKPFMSCVNRLANEMNIPGAQRYHEFFGPTEDLEDVG